MSNKQYRVKVNKSFKGELTLPFFKYAVKAGTVLTLNEEQYSDHATQFALGRNILVVEEQTVPKEAIVSAKAIEQAKTLVETEPEQTEEIDVSNNMADPDWGQQRVKEPSVWQQEINQMQEAQEVQVLVGEEGKKFSKIIQAQLDSGHVTDDEMVEPKSKVVDATEGEPENHPVAWDAKNKKLLGKNDSMKLALDQLKATQAQLMTGEVDFDKQEAKVAKEGITTIEEQATQPAEGPTTAKETTKATKGGKKVGRPKKEVKTITPVGNKKESEASPIDPTPEISLPLPNISGDEISFVDQEQTIARVKAHPKFKGKNNEEVG